MALDSGMERDEKAAEDIFTLKKPVSIPSYLESAGEEVTGLLEAMKKGSMSLKELRDYAKGGVLVPMETGSVKVSVSKINYRKILGGEEVTSDESVVDTIEVIKFAAAVAKITYHAGMTISLGDYQFARIDVGLELPAYMEQSEEAYAAAKDFVEERLSKEIKEVRGARKPKEEE